MKKIKKQVELPSTDEDIKTQMNKFLEVRQNQNQIKSFMFA
jgi:hypothetical protein